MSHVLVDKLMYAIQQKLEFRTKTLNFQHSCKGGLIPKMQSLLLNAWAIVSKSNGSFITCESFVNCECAYLHCSCFGVFCDVA